MPPSDSDVRIGLDAEALSGPEWFPSKFQTKLAVSFAWGTKKSDIESVQSYDMTAGVWLRSELLEVAEEFYDAEDCIVVAHNARYDLDLLNGTLLTHNLRPLPSGIRYQDTMNTLKTGSAYRNRLSDRCAAMGVNLKTGGPDWLKVLQRDREEWVKMATYNENDVICALALERAYAKAGNPVPIKVWNPRR